MLWRDLALVFGVSATRVRVACIGPSPTESNLTLFAVDIAPDAHDLERYQEQAALLASGSKLFALNLSATEACDPVVHMPRIPQKERSVPPMSKPVAEPTFGPSAAFAQSTSLFGVPTSDGYLGILSISPASSPAMSPAGSPEHSPRKLTTTQKSNALYRPVVAASPAVSPAHSPRQPVPSFALNASQASPPSSARAGDSQRLLSRGTCRLRGVCMCPRFP
jgi:hypothetical protein